MKYRIDWSQRALDAAARYWLNVPHDMRAKITKATAMTDRVLTIDPENEGESRTGDERILFMSPLIVTFAVDNLNRVVQILNIRRDKRGR